MKRLEVLLLAIAHVNGTFKSPDSKSFKLANPLMLKSFALPGIHEVDEEGHRKFDSFSGGFRAAEYDLRLKLTGQSRVKLKPTDLLENVLRIYGISDLTAQRSVVSFCKRAIVDESISIKTPISYFIEDLEEKKVEAAHA